jgi:flagellar protein FliO/FliZ
MRICLLLIILILPLPLYQAEAPAAATQPVVVSTVTTPVSPEKAALSAGSAVPGGAPSASASAASAAPLFSDAEWQHGQGGATQPQSGSGVVAKAGLGLLLSLVAIAIIAGVLAIVLRKLGMRRVLPGRGRHLTVIETVPLGFKRSVSLLRIGDQVLVVGQGEHDLSHLATLPASILNEPTPKTVEPVIDAPIVGQPPPPASGFRAVLDAIAGRRP